MLPSRTISRRLVVVCLLILVTTVLPAHAQVAGATADTFDADVATAWFNLQLELIKTTPGFSPPVASRAFGYLGVTLYEAIVPGMPGYQSLAGQLNALAVLPQPAPGADYHWPTVANSALATATRELFANASEENLAAIDALYERLAAEFELDADVFSRSVRHGHDVATAVYTWSMTDGAHEGYLYTFPSDYVPPSGSGFWIPTPRVNGDPQPALQPYWGNNRPFVLDSGDTCMPPAPPAYSEDPASAFYVEAMEVYETTQNLTAEQEEIAVFWADNPGETATPPGHSISILTQILTQEDATLDFAAEAYARLGIAVADAFIGCWYAKYEYNLLRPVTYIQQVMDEAWMPPLNTPPFPEYPSGHSVQSGAAAVVLAGLFGEAYSFTDHTHDEMGLAPRSFNSFAEAAEEAAISRLYGGIHYRAAIELGVEQGSCIGEQVNALAFHVAI